MRLPVASAFVLLTAIAALGSASGCSAGEKASSDDEGAALSLDTNHLAITPGVERLRGHNAPNDVVAAQTKSLDIKNAYWLARLSQLVYSNEADIKTGLDKLGLKSDDDHFRFFDNSCTDAQAFYVTTASLRAPLVDNNTPYQQASPDFAVLVFRGTEEHNGDDITTDLQLWNRPGVSPIGNAHAGFMRSLVSLWEAPKPGCGSFEAMGTFLRAHHQWNGRGARPVRRGPELYLTGHSLGGAIATLALAKTATEQCEKEGKWQEDACFLEYTPVSALVTFGGPRVGDRSLGTTIASWMQDRTPMFRFIHGRDLVVGLPKVFGWYHPGYDGDENSFKVIVTDDPLKMTLSKEAERGAGSQTEDHRIKNYLPALEKLARAASGG